MPEEIIFDKFGTMLVQDLQLSAIPNAYINAAFLGLGGLFWRFSKRFHNGYWAGGRIILTSTRLKFAQAAINRALSSTAVKLDIPLSEIIEVDDRPAFLNRIIDVKFGDPPQTVSIRCFGAKKAIQNILIQRDLLRAE